MTRTRKDPLPGEAAAERHYVQFYEDDSALVAQIGRAMCVALDQGHAAICIATQSHRQLLEKQLQERGIDLSVARAVEQYVHLDAAQTISRIIVDGKPDTVRFAEVVGSLVDRLCARHTRVWMFGEMVSLLCADGNQAGALALEKLWTSFIASQPVCLYCAYPTQLFSSDDVRAFEQICDEHCRVLHSDSSLALANGKENGKDSMDRKRALAARTLPVRVSVEPVKRSQSGD